MKPALDDFTDAQLRLAWNFMRRPASWPEDMAAALADERRRGLFLHFATTFLRERERRAAAAPPPIPAPVPRPPAPSIRKPAAPRFDARRAAANDLQD